MSTPEPTVTADIDLAIGRRRLQARIGVPAGPTQLVQLLPVVRALTDAAVAAAAEDAAALGRPISCRAGCAACCRHLVPVTQTEARHLRDLVEAMPGPRRSQVKARFAAAQAHLVEAGLLEDLSAPAPWREEARQPCGDEYLALGIACPFLEDESCSIYAERPLVCREYVVVSAPEHCGTPRSTDVRVVKMPFDAWRALARTASPQAGDRVPWVPLVTALEWADAHPEPPAGQTGPQLLQELFGHLTGKHVPPAQGVTPPCPKSG